MRNKRIAAFALLLLFFLISVTFSKSYVNIDSIKGTAELQSEGTVEWKNITKATKLYNNDKVRVSDSGLVILHWPNGTITYVNQKSQILITIFQKKNEKTILTNATIMFGAAFFLVKNKFLKDKSEEMRVYTPTAELSIRGTSFLVAVDLSNTSTTVKMLNGFLMVKNIAKNISFLLGTPYQTVIVKNENPSTSAVVLQNDIDSMKQWIPLHIIENEISSQMDKSKQDRIELASNFDGNCLITQFTNASEYNGIWNIEQEITRHFTTLLRRNLSRLAVMATDSIVNDPLEAAKAFKTRYCISGKVDNFELSKYAAISVLGDKYSESILAKVSVNLKLTDLLMNKVLLDETFTSDFSGKNNLENTWDTFHKNAFNLSDTSFTKTIIGMAAQMVIIQSITSVTKSLQQ
jgi:hypothetical protein